MLIRISGALNRIYATLSCVYSHLYFAESCNTMGYPVASGGECECGDAHFASAGTGLMLDCSRVTDADHSRSRDTTRPVRTLPADAEASFPQRPRPSLPPPVLRTSLSCANHLPPRPPPHPPVLYSLALFPIRFFYLSLYFRDHGRTIRLCYGRQVPPAPRTKGRDSKACFEVRPPSHYPTGQTISKDAYIYD